MDTDGETSRVNIGDTTYVKREDMAMPFYPLTTYMYLQIYKYPLKPHFCIVKLGYAGLYIFCLFFCPKHRFWVLVRTAS